MDSTAGLECLDWINNHHFPDDLHLSNSHKEKTLDHQNLNLLDTINVYSHKSEEDSLKGLHGITDLKKNVNNNNNNNNMPPNRSDIVNEEAAGRRDSLSPFLPPENKSSSLEIKYDLSALHLSGKASPFKHLLDAECESIHSDYSEVVGPLRDLADNEIEIFHAEDLAKENLSEKKCLNTYSIGNKTLKQEPEESDEEFQKRVKKVNFLSLAQEFAELKKIDADVLPFDLHKTNFSDYSPMSEESSLTESAMTTPIEPGKDLLNNEYVRDENSNELDSVDCCDPETIMDSDEKDIRSSSLNPKDLSSGGTDTSKMSPQRRGKQNLSLFGENKLPQNNELIDEEECEIYSENTLPPKMDWETLELQLAMAAEEKERLARYNDREEIRRKLAMGTDEEYYSSDRLYKKSNMQGRHHQGDLNLQLCFMNDAAAAIPINNSDSSGGNSDQESGTKQQQKNNGSSSSNLTELKPKFFRDHPPPNKPPRKKGDGSDTEEEDFFRKQARLQEEAKLALAQASTMAHMQLEVEKQMKKKSPIAEMVGIPGFGDGRQKRLQRKLLLDMNVAQLQVIVNDLLSQIKSLNEDLVQMLLDRDDLHMEQDSMLVDIEDLTRRAQDFAKKINSKQKKDNKKK